MQQQWAEMGGEYALNLADGAVSRHQGGTDRLLDTVLGTQPSSSREHWILDAVVRVAGEGDGDGIAGAPENLLHPVQVLRA